VRAPAGCWWARPAHDRLVIYCPSGSAERVERILRAETVHHPGLVADRRRDSYMLLGVVGHCAPQVLEALGVRLPDGGSFGGTGVTVLDGAAVTWLAESPESVIACVPANRGEDVAASIERAGSPYGMVRISEEAFAHWSVGDRQRRRLTR